MAPRKKTTTKSTDASMQEFPENASKPQTRSRKRSPKTNSNIEIPEKLPKREMPKRTTSRAADKKVEAQNEEKAANTENHHVNISKGAGGVNKSDGVATQNIGPVKLRLTKCTPARAVKKLPTTNSKLQGEHSITEEIDGATVSEAQDVDMDQVSDSKASIDKCTVAVSSRESQMLSESAAHTSKIEAKSKKILLIPETYSKEVNIKNEVVDGDQAKCDTHKKNNAATFHSTSQMHCQAVSSKRRTRKDNNVEASGSVTPAQSGTTLKTKGSKAKELVASDSENKAHTSKKKTAYGKTRGESSRKTETPLNRKFEPMPVREDDFASKRTNVTNANFLAKYQSGLIGSVDCGVVRKRGIVKYLRTFSAATVELDFDRRVTAVEWHPFDSKVVAVASKAGDLKLWHTATSSMSGPGFEGIGPGGSIQTLRFDPSDPNTNILAVSLAGTFFKYDYISHNTIVYLDTGDFNKWYLSLDVHGGMRTMAVGDTQGHLTMLSYDGIRIGEYKLHKKTKISHVEFSDIDPYIICTASNDKFVKIWDTRMFGEKNCEPLHVLQHDSPINSAVFSKTDGARLLTTDQNCHLNIYRAPLFHLERSIIHPHRHFQHLTPIQATWHPLEDIVVVGRYPDPKLNVDDEMRSVDFFDAATGDLLYQCFGHKFIKSINKFNCSGDAMLSCIGSSVLLWEPFSVRSAHELEGFRCNY